MVRGLVVRGFGVSVLKPKLGDEGQTLAQTYETWPRQAQQHVKSIGLRDLLHFKCHTL